MNGAQNDTRQSGYPEYPDPGYQQTAPGTPHPGYAGPVVPPSTARVSHKSPSLATWLSLGPGLGQIYVGYYNQGFVNIAVCAGIITALTFRSLSAVHPFLGVFLAFYWLYNMIDANRRAHHYNKAMAGLGGETVPEDFKLPAGRGSMFGGVVLILVGVLFILDLNFDISMEWIENWWPLTLVGFGGYLIDKARRNRD